MASTVAFWVVAAVAVLVYASSRLDRQARETLDAAREAAFEAQLRSQRPDLYVDEQASIVHDACGELLEFPLNPGWDEDDVLVTLAEIESL